MTIAVPSSLARGGLDCAHDDIKRVELRPCILYAAAATKTLKVLSLDIFYHVDDVSMGASYSYMKRREPYQPLPFTSRITDRCLCRGSDSII